MIALAEAGIFGKGKKIVVQAGARRARSGVELALAGASHLTIVNIPKDMALGSWSRRCARTQGRGRPCAGSMPSRFRPIPISSTTRDVDRSLSRSMKPNIDYDTLTTFDVRDVIPNPASRLSAGGRQASSGKAVCRCWSIRQPNITM